MPCRQCNILVNRHGQVHKVAVHVFHTFSTGVSYSRGCCRKSGSYNSMCTTFTQLSLVLWFLYTLHCLAIYVTPQYCCHMTSSCCLKLILKLLQTYKITTKLNKNHFSHNLHNTFYDTQFQK